MRQEKRDVAVGVASAGDAGFDLAKRDLITHQNGGLEACARTAWETS